MDFKGFKCGCHLSHLIHLQSPLIFISVEFVSQPYWSLTFQYTVGNTVCKQCTRGSLHHQTSLDLVVVCQFVFLCRCVKPKLHWVRIHSNIKSNKHCRSCVIFNIWVTCASFVEPRCSPCKEDKTDSKPISNRYVKCVCVCVCQVRKSLVNFICITKIHSDTDDLASNAGFDIADECPLSHAYPTGMCRVAFTSNIAYSIQLLMPKNRIR